MADGFRIRPREDHLKQDLAINRMIVLRDISRPIPPHPENPVCRICLHPHDCKTYHFQLDAEGTIIVSSTIWDRLQNMPLNGGFEFINVVSDPPDQHIRFEPLGRT